PAAVTARVAVEAGVADSWLPLVGPDGDVVAMRGYGESAPGRDVYEHFGLTTEAVVQVASALL
ncbi:MAG TPA: hypothetical protein VKA32_09485, partial [Gammaproteobacteria bacterium]|nr:hypothetical protein [Gammaproteobacteria bacterium]